jgi:hypothetical protein
LEDAGGAVGVLLPGVDRTMIGSDDPAWSLPVTMSLAPESSV